VDFCRIAYTVIVIVLHSKFAYHLVGLPPQAQVDSPKWAHQKEHLSVLIHDLRNQSTLGPPNSLLQGVHQIRDHLSGTLIGRHVVVKVGDVQALLPLFSSDVSKP
jgi:hypothetical protein